MSEPAPIVDPTSAASARPRRQFPCLDAFRAIAMTMIIVFHADYDSLANSHGELGAIFRRLDFGVALFFVLSAFLLFRPYVVALFRNEPGMRTVDFYQHRVLRIFPGYWLALAAMVVFFGMRFRDLGDALSFVFILQPYTGAVLDPRYADFQQAWSLATEVAFYLLVPLVAFWLGRRLLHHARAAQLRCLLVVVGAGYAIGVISRVVLVNAPWSWQRHLLYALPSWLDLFAIGAALAVVSAWSTETGGVFAPLEWLGRHPVLSWLGACAVFLLTTRMHLSNDPFTIDGQEYVARYLLYGITALLLLAPGMFGDQQVGRLRAVLRSRPLVILGTVSLGFYLFHKAVLSQVADWTDAAPFQAHLWKLLLIAYPLSVAIAAVSYYAVERPALHLKRTASASSAARTPAP